MWIAGVLTTFTLMFLALNYGNAIRWQIRAQNAADSAAQGIASIQAQRWNIMTATLYGANVEEYRLRRTLDAMLLNIDQSGGCTQAYNQYNYDDLTLGSCNRNYIDLRDAYLRAVKRYGADVELLNNVSTLNTYTNWQGDAASLLARYAQTGVCNASDATQAPGGSKIANPTGGDCGFKYTLNAFDRRLGLLAVEQDAQGFLLPGLGRTGTIAADLENKELFAPVEVDVVTCATVPPIIPNFGPIHFASYKAIGRAAATNVMVEEDWMQPGAVVDPQRSGSQYFQPKETYTTPSAGSATYDWYNIDYGGNTGTAYANYGVFYEPLNHQELDVRMGWWGAVPIRPFGPNLDTAKTC